MKLLLAGLFTIILISVGVIIYNTYPPQWKELPCGLWINADGDIGLKTLKAISEESDIDFYITQSVGGAQLKTLIDTATFHYLGGSFYKDKNHIYNHMPMSDGGNFYPINDKVDYSTFEILGDYYARDKNHIYRANLASVVEDADYETFRVTEGGLAQDKNGFFSWGDRITGDEAKKLSEILNSNKK